MDFNDGDFPDKTCAFGFRITEVPTKYPHDHIGVRLGRIALSSVQSSGGSSPAHTTKPTFSRAATDRLSRASRATGTTLRDSNLSSNASFRHDTFELPISTSRYIGCLARFPCSTTSGSTSTNSLTPSPANRYATDEPIPPHPAIPTRKALILRSVANPVLGPSTASRKAKARLVTGSLYADPSMRAVFGSTFLSAPLNVRTARSAPDKRASARAQPSGPTA